MDPHCFDADTELNLDPAQNLDADLDQIQIQIQVQGEGEGVPGRSAKNVHPP